MSILSLPLELKCLIMTYLDIQSAYWFCDTCKYGQKILTNHTYWNQLAIINDLKIGNKTICDLKTYLWFRDFPLRFDFLWQKLLQNSIIYLNDEEYKNYFK